RPTGSARATPVFRSRGPRPFPDTAGGRPASSRTKRPTRSVSRSCIRTSPLARRADCPATPKQLLLGRAVPDLARRSYQLTPGLHDQLSRGQRPDCVFDRAELAQLSLDQADLVQLPRGDEYAALQRPDGPVVGRHRVRQCLAEPIDMLTQAGDPVIQLAAEIK